MKISILTLFPEMFTGPFDLSIIKRAKEKKFVEINIINIRDFGIGKHKVVDDKPYGGGRGMILRVDVLEKAILETKIKTLKSSQQKIVLLDARGKTFNQKIAERFSKLKHLILICGHYEGVDERIREFTDDVISIGDFIATGGEIPSMLIVDSVVRLQKGLLKKEVTSQESFSRATDWGIPILEYPQYTRPEVFKKLNVPKILLTGDHKKIENFRKEMSKKITQKRFEAISSQKDW